MMFIKLVLGQATLYSDAMIYDLYLHLIKPCTNYVITLYKCNMEIRPFNPQR